MRIYQSAYELMSETGRNLWEMGSLVEPKRYQNKNIEGNSDFITKELICEQYSLIALPDPMRLFTYMGPEHKAWADEEFLERVSGQTMNPGEAWKLRRGTWEEFLRDDGTFDYSYPDRINQKMTYCDSKGESVSTTYLQEIIQLLKEDPDTRKAVLAIYNAEEDKFGVRGNYRIPCSMYYDFLLRTDADNKSKVLHICYHQRSSDFVTFFGSDVYLAWKLKDWVAEQLGVKPGYLIHTIDSLHAYKKDWTTLKTCLEQL